MTISVFGGTGGTGAHIVRQALDAGMTVKVLARTPEKVTVVHEALHVIPGDVSDPEKVEETVTGAGAVLSALGAAGLGETSIYSDSIALITPAMERQGVRRILCVGAVGMEPGRDRNIPFIGQLVIRLLLRNVLADMYRMQQHLESTSLDWTVMWPPQLNEGELTGVYRTETDHAVPRGKVISRADLAHYMVGHIEGSDHPRKVAIAY